MKCKACQEWYKKYPLKKIDKEMVHEIEKEFHYSPIRCAFENGVFSKENWNCQTMSKLREVCDYSARDDMSAGSMGAMPIDESEKEGIQQGFIIMTWYKDRGATGAAYVMEDESEPELLNLKTAEFMMKREI